MSDCDSALTFWSAILSIRVFTGADFLRVSTVPLLILCNSSCVDNCGYSNIQHAMYRLYVYVYNKNDHTTNNRNSGIYILYTCCGIKIPDVLTHTFWYAYWWFSSTNFFTDAALAISWFVLEYSVVVLVTEPMRFKGFHSFTTTCFNSTDQLNKIYWFHFHHKFTWGLDV